MDCCSALGRGRNFIPFVYWGPIHTLLQLSSRTVSLGRSSKLTIHTRPLSLKNALYLPRARFVHLWRVCAVSGEFLHCVKLEYLDATVLRRGVGEVRVVVGRDQACWQGWRDVCSHWKQTNDLSQHPSTFRNGLGEPMRSFSWTVSSKYYNYMIMSFFFFFR
jgi:hypothetical protein